MRCPKTMERTGRGDIGQYFDRLQWSSFFGMDITKDDFQPIFSTWIDMFNSLE